MLNVLVIGTGNYVGGRGGIGFGTILPALCEWKRRGRALGTVIFVGASETGARALSAKVQELETLMQVSLGARCLPEGPQDDSVAYLRAMEKIPRPACAIVVVPDQLHSCVATHAMDAGLHTLVVKPLAPTVAEVLALLKIQQKQGVYGAVEFHKRWDAANLMLNDALASGKLGDPQYILVEYSQRKDVPSNLFKAWAGTTHSFQYLGVHYVDIIYFSTRAVPLRVTATGQRRWLQSQGINTYDAVQALIEWRMPAGAVFTSVFLTNWVDPSATSALSDQKIKVIGTKGRYESDQKRRGIQIVTDDAGIEEPNPDFCSSYKVPGTQSIGYRGYGIESVHAFLADVEKIVEGSLCPSDLEGRRPTFRDAIVSTAVVEAANRSLEKKGEWVDIELPTDW